MGRSDEHAMALERVETDPISDDTPPAPVSRPEEARLVSEDTPLAPLARTDDEETAAMPSLPAEEEKTAEMSASAASRAIASTLPPAEEEKTAEMSAIAASHAIAASSRGARKLAGRIGIPLPGDETPILQTKSGERTPSRPITRPRRRETSFGAILIDRGLITPGELDKVLKIQRERSRKGDFARLGHILVETGVLTNEQVQTVLEAQAITILTCEACASQYNIHGYQKDRGYRCPKCHSSLRHAAALQHVAVQDQLNRDGAARPAPVAPAPTVSPTARIRARGFLGKYEILGEIARGGMGIDLTGSGTRSVCERSRGVMKTLLTDELERRLDAR